MTETPELPVLPGDEHDRELVAHVRPPGWVNPTPADPYHLVVLGAGTAGLVTAALAAGLGARVALVERSLMGGDCLNVGCVPSKGVLRAARAWQAARAGIGFGAPSPGAADGDFARAMERTRRIRAEIAPHDGAARFRDLGVDVFLGSGRFVASDAVEVDGRRLRFRRAVIATGGRAAVPPIAGLDGTDFLTHERLFTLTERPARLGVLGAGPIGCEMAQAFRRLGSEVTLLDQAPRILPREDPDAAELLQRRLAAEGVELHCGVEVREVRNRDGATLVAARRDGRALEVEVDRLLVATGRRPNVEGLELEAAGVDYGKGGVVVDDHLRTTNRRIWACGDVAADQQFTHLAEAQARIVVQNALFLRRLRASDLVVPRCIFTSPEIAHVGLTAEEAEKSGPVRTITVGLEDNDRGRIEGDEGFLRVHLEGSSDRILGGTVVGEDAGELLAPLCGALTHGQGLAKLGETILPYPTRAMVYRQAAGEWQRSRLTPTLQRVLDLWLRLLR